MDVYNVPEHGQGGAYLIQGTAGLNSQLTTPVGETFETMYNEGAPEFIVDQGLYYPTASATNYGYFCTGLESPGDWADHHGVFGVDGQDIQFLGAQTENFPYVYYTPSYGYAQSPYNPYNPYIPGAMIGADGSFVGTPQYFIPSYENGASSPSYSSMVAQSGSDTLSSSTTDQFMGMNASTPIRVDASGFKRNLSSASATFTLNPGKGASNHANSFPRVPESLKSNGAPTKLPAAHSSVALNGFSGPTSSQVRQGRGAQVTEDHSIGKALPSHNHNQLKSAFPSGNGSNGRVVGDNIQPKLPFGRSANDLNGNPDALTEQNRGPRTNKSKTQLTVKAYSTRAGDSDGQGNIIIHTDQYNRDDFPVEYANAKFFVIKSYSEDDVHKSIKYNVWSSTPNGNKKLNSAYEEAQKIAAGDPKGCPIFLFFSVNASGQFCGVAEMIGHVDFHRDMDFWQQDKWSGSFPVKWHIIKDVANPNFRHIILENNEHKPVTNSRDTQEIKYKKGLEMLKVFKNYVSKTSLLDDFTYYENRQKMMLEERARLLIKSYGTPVFVPVLDPPRKINNLFDLHSTENEKPFENNDLETRHNEIKVAPKVANNDSNSKQVVDENTSAGDALKMGSLAISPKQIEPKPMGSLTISPKQIEPKPMGSLTISPSQTEPKPNVVTVGSMEVKVNGSSGAGSMEVKVNGSSGVGSKEVKVNRSSSVLTVGTIPLDPKILKVNKAGGSANLAKTYAKKG